MDLGNLNLSLFLAGPELLFQGDKFSNFYQVTVNGDTPATVTVDLYVDGSESMPTEDHEGPWQHLIPRWWFEDEQGNRITRLTIDIKNDNGMCIGIGKFRYIDQMPSGNHTNNLTVTLDPTTVVVYPIGADGVTSPEGVTLTSEGTNSKLIAVKEVYIKAVTPTKLCITRNGIDSMSKEVYWKGLRIPFITTIEGAVPPYLYNGFHNDPNHPEKYVPNDTIIYQFPAEGVRTPDLSLKYENGDEYTNAISKENGGIFDDCMFSLHDAEGNYFRTGGYAIGNVVPPATGENCTLDASFTDWKDISSGDSVNDVILKTVIFKTDNDITRATSFVDFSTTPLQQPYRINDLRMNGKPVDSKYDNVHDLYWILDENDQMWALDQYDNVVYGIDDSGINNLAGHDLNYNTELDSMPETRSDRYTSQGKRVGNQMLLLSRDKPSNVLYITKNNTLIHRRGYAITCYHIEKTNDEIIAHKTASMSFYPQDGIATGVQYKVRVRDRISSDGNDYDTIPENWFAYPPLLPKGIIYYDKTHYVNRTRGGYAITDFDHYLPTNKQNEYNDPNYGPDYDAPITTDYKVIKRFNYQETRIDGDGYEIAEQISLINFLPTNKDITTILYPVYITSCICEGNPYIYIFFIDTTNNVILMKRYDDPNLDNETFMGYSNNEQWFYTNYAIVKDATSSDICSIWDCGRYASNLYNAYNENVSDQNGQHPTVNVTYGPMWRFPYGKVRNANNFNFFAQPYLRVKTENNKPILNVITLSYGQYYSMEKNNDFAFANHSLTPYNFPVYLQCSRNQHIIVEPFLTKCKDENGCVITDEHGNPVGYTHDQTIGYAALYYTRHQQSEGSAPAGCNYSFNFCNYCTKELSYKQKSVVTIGLFEDNSINKGVYRTLTESYSVANHFCQAETVGNTTYAYYTCGRNYSISLLLYDKKAKLPYSDKYPELASEWEYACKSLGAALVPPIEIQKTINFGLSRNGKYTSNYSQNVHADQNGWYSPCCGTWGIDRTCENNTSTYFTHFKTYLNQQSLTIFVENYTAIGFYYNPNFRNKTCVIKWDLDISNHADAPSTGWEGKLVFKYTKSQTMGVLLNQYDLPPDFINPQTYTFTRKFAMDIIRSEDEKTKFSSDPFEIDDYNYHIRKFNDSWNTTKHMAYATGVTAFKDNSDDLFNKFINGALGGSGTTGEYSIGRKIYEAIANQVANVHDVDECGIEALYSLANSQDVPLDAFALYTPEELKRAMDLISVTHEKLWGDRCHCNKFYFIDNSTRTYKNSEGQIVTEKDRHLKRLCPYCGHEHGTNVGDSADDLISIKLDIAGEHPPYLVRPKNSDANFMKIVPSVESIAQSDQIHTHLGRFSASLVGSAQYTLQQLEEAIKGIWDNPEIAPEDKERAFKDATMWYSLLLLVEKDYKRLAKCTDQTERNEILASIKHKQLVALHTSLFTPQPWTNYCFFQFLDRHCDTQNTGVIKWEDKNTEIDEGRVNKEKASIDDWLKSKGTVDRILTYIMKKNLGY